jgi:hypothetical protein
VAVPRHDDCVLASLGPALDVRARRLRSQRQLWLKGEKWTDEFAMPRGDEVMPIDV